MSITALLLILCSIVVGSVILQNASSPSDTEELNVISEETRRSLVYHDIFIVDMMSMQPTFMINDIVFIRYVNTTNIDNNDLIALSSPFGDKRIHQGPRNIQGCNGRGQGPWRAQAGKEPCKSQGQGRRYKEGKGLSS